MAIADFLIVGGGIAGLSAAARLARHGRIVVLEAETALGHHSSGRSASFSHYGIGDATVRALTRHSRKFLIAPPDGFTDFPLVRPSPALFIATAAMIPELQRLEREMAVFTNSLRAVGEAEMRQIFPPLRTGPDHVVAGLLYEDGLRLDSDALLQGFARTVRTAGGEVLNDRRIARIEPRGGAWTARTDRGESFSAPVLVNAAGAWADAVAVMAGVAPLGLTPLRRTIIVVDPPRGADVRSWPFVKTASDDFYVLPEGGRLMASPMDETPDHPCDAQPDPYDIALAADRLGFYTTLSVERIAHRWAGLRTFAADRVPVAGFAPDAPGFFWLAGQGGFGLQTAPAMAEAAEVLITGRNWPAALAALGVQPEALRPERLLSA